MYMYMCIYIYIYTYYGWVYNMRIYRCVYVKSSLACPRVQQSDRLVRSQVQDTVSFQNVMRF